MILSLSVSGHGFHSTAFCKTELRRLEGTLIRAGENRSALLLGPGLQDFATERLFLDPSAQVPLYEEVEREGLESRWNALFQLRWAF